MSWNQSQVDEVGMFVAKNAPRPVSHLPFMVLYDRLSYLIHVYLVPRVERGQLPAKSEMVWKAAWLNANQYASSGVGYREWLLGLADEIVRVKQSDRTAASPAKAHEVARDPEEELAIAQRSGVRKLIAAIRTLPQDHLDAYRARVLGYSTAEIERALQIERSRIERWFASAAVHLQRASGVDCPLVSASSPTTEEEFSRWIEQVFCTFEFDRWFAELFALGQATSTAAAQDLKTILADKCGGLLEHGFRSLSRQQITSLLQRPALLLSMQRLIFAQGESYWLEKLEKPSNIDEADLLRTRVALMLSPDAVQLNRTATGQSKASSKVWVWAVGAVCLIIVVGSLTYVLFSSRYYSRRAATPWDLNASMTRLEDVGSREYLSSLAGEFERWFEAPSKDSTELTERLKLLQRNLQTLSAAQHDELREKDRVWLLAQGKRWNERCTQLLNEIQATGRFAVDDANALAEEIISELHRRSASADR